MQLIPVIDLIGGQVVHAVRGDRAHYHPLRSLIAEGSDPESIVAALLMLASFRTLYIADLDAIQRRGDNRNVIEALHRRFPTLALWVDAGYSDDESLSAHVVGRPVIGTETLLDCATLDRAKARGDPVLSLDFHGEQFVGPTELLTQPERWPLRVIVMTLARVGSRLGPDESRLLEARARAPHHAIFAAGGVRHADDLARLTDLGVAGVLLASALHDGSLSADCLARYS